MLVGFPIKEHEVANKDQAEWIPESAINLYINNGFIITGRKRMNHAPPSFIEGKEKGLLLLMDDYTRADSRFMQACMSLIETQGYMSWKLPEDSHIILTTNPDDGNYNVTSLDGAQKTRFITVNMKFDGDVWARWAETQGVDGRCINFLLLHPELVKGDVNPRAIMTFFNSISSIPEFKDSLPLIQMIGEGSVGPEFATMFSTFINNRLDKLVSPKDIIFNTNEPYIIGAIKDCIGRGNAYRADIASVITTRLINYIVLYSETNSIDDAIINRLVKLATDSTPDSLTNDLKYLLVKRILNANKQKFGKLMTNTDVMKMAMK